MTLMQKVAEKHNCCKHSHIGREPHIAMERVCKPTSTMTIETPSAA